MYNMNFLGNPDSKRLLVIKYITAYSAHKGVEVLSAEWAQAELSSLYLISGPCLNLGTILRTVRWGMWQYERPRCNPCRGPAAQCIRHMNGIEI
jgi:hypothetical protein